VVVVASDDESFATVGDREPLEHDTNPTASAVDAIHISCRRISPPPSGTEVRHDR
jgi:hypothetical protein